MSSPASNPNVPAVPQPSSDPASVPFVLSRLREGVESLSGHRGDPLARAVTFNDLITLGLVTAVQVKARL